MTFKIKISLFYEKSEPKKWKQKKIRYFSIGNIEI